MSEEIIARYLRVGLLAFLILFGFGLSRPMIESLFLETYTTQSLPWVWLSVAFVTLVVTRPYQWAILHMGGNRTFQIVACVSALLFAVMVTTIRVWDGSKFALYIWKDVHVVLLLELVWGIANSTFSIQHARWSYGAFCLCGSAGGVIGSLMGGALARTWGSDAALLAAIPSLLIAAITVRYGNAASSGEDHLEKTVAPHVGIMSVLRHPYLRKMALLVGVVQMVITLIDFHFNVMLERSYPVLDERTAALSLVYAWIDGASFALQLLTAPILRIAGVPLVLLSVPVALFGLAGASALGSRFVYDAVLKVASKSFDYSLFRSAKEILYIPLTLATKSSGKAVIDILIYRGAKAAASLCLILIAPQRVLTLLAIVLGLLCVWLAITRTLVRDYRLATKPTHDV